MISTNSESTQNLQRARCQRGFTLIELLLVVTIIGILVTISNLGWGILMSQRLSSTAAELLVDLQAVRLNALTQSSETTSRGYGLRFETAGSYKVFEFIDSGATDFKYEGVGEEKRTFDKELPDSISVTIGAAASPINMVSGVDQKVLIYDKRGMVRDHTWSAAANRTYVLKHSRVAQARCVVISRVRIREGLWNGASCAEL